MRPGQCPGDGLRVGYEGQAGACHMGTEDHNNITQLSKLKANINLTLINKKSSS